jgi:hypothetical protein
MDTHTFETSSFSVSHEQGPSRLEIIIGKGHKCFAQYIQYIPWIQTKSKMTVGCGTSHTNTKAITTVQQALKIHPHT